MTSSLPPFQKHSATSRAAALAMYCKAGTLRNTVYRYISLTKKRGATDNEMQRELFMSGSTQRPRRIELVNAGLVADSGRKRGRSTVWVCSDLVDPMRDA